MFATRFFLDNDFSTVVPAPGLVEQLRNLPVKLDHAQNIIQKFLAGSIFDGPRKFKAGLVNSRKCEHCDADDDLLHMSKHCPTNPPPEVSVQMPDTSWTMGVLWESERDTQFRLQQDQPFQFGDLPPKHVLQPGDRIFTDGSFIRSKSGRLESAACSVYIPQILQLARPLPGLDQSSQRAELGAILLALKVTDGDAHIFTDCATIVKGFREQSRNAQGFSSLRSWDNFDLWTLIAAETCLNHRTVHVSKVSAHGRDPSQDPGLTEGNEKADALAKSLCQRQFQQHSDHSVCDVNCILAVQIHLIKSFVNRNLLTQPPDHDQIVDRALSTLKVATARKCTCPPSRRIRG
jgi:ribonuclease HI